MILQGLLQLRVLRGVPVVVGPVGLHLFVQGPEPFCQAADDAYQLILVWLAYLDAPAHKTRSSSMSCT